LAGKDAFLQLVERMVFAAPGRRIGVGAGGGVPQQGVARRSGPGCAAGQQFAEMVGVDYPPAWVLRV
jgi:hypothetical protein